MKLFTSTFLLTALTATTTLAIPARLPVNVTEIFINGTNADSTIIEVPTHIPFTQPSTSNITVYLTRHVEHERSSPPSSTWWKKLLNMLQDASKEQEIQHEKRDLVADIDWERGYDFVVPSPDAYEPSGETCDEFCPGPNPQYKPPHP